MSVTDIRYKPLLVSERIEPNDLGQYDLCRAAVFAMMLNGSTNGEWMKNLDGTDWGRKKLKRMLEKMRAKTGQVLRGSFNTSHMAAFAKGVGWPADTWDPEIKTFRHFKAGLATGKWNYSLSGDVKYTPAGSPLRKWVNPGVGHNIFVGWITKDGDHMGFIDPMTPHGTKRVVRWAPTWHFRAFASKFKDASGRIVCGRVRKGVNTEANRVRRNRGRIIVKLQEDLIELTDLWRKQQAELTVQDTKLVNRAAKIDQLRSEIGLLEIELSQCGENPAEMAACQERLEELTSRLDRIAAIALD